MAGRRFRTLELDEDEVDFLLRFDPEDDLPPYTPPAQLVTAYRKYAATVQSYIADGLA